MFNRGGKCRGEIVRHFVNKFSAEVSTAVFTELHGILKKILGSASGGSTERAVRAVYSTNLMQVHSRADRN